VNDQSSLDGIAMMAPLADLGLKADKTNAMNASEPIASEPSSFSSAGASSVSLIGSWNQLESKPSTDVNAEKTSVKSVSSGAIEVRFTDDYFSDFDDKKIM
jgi:hypothetical protein